VGWSSCLGSVSTSRPTA